MTNDFTYLGRGIYTVAEASRLVGLEESRVRRWMRGYYFKSKGKEVYSPPIVGFETSQRESRESLSFADLIEVLYLEHFSRAGVPTRALRLAAKIAREEMGTPHPFATHRFRTDGRWILQELTPKGPRSTMFNLITAQLESEALIHSLLKGDLEFDGKMLVERWWPLSKRRDVVVDPQRRFGAPISASSGVPTDVLARSFRAERAYARTASWYHVSVKAVKDAVFFERQLASAA